MWFPQFLTTPALGARTEPATNRSSRTPKEAQIYGQTSISKRSGAGHHCGHCHPLRRPQCLPEPPGINRTSRSCSWCTPLDRRENCSVGSYGPRIVVAIPPFRATTGRLSLPGIYQPLPGTPKSSLALPLDLEPPRFQGTSRSDRPDWQYTGGRRPRHAENGPITRKQAPYDVGPTHPCHPYVSIGMDFQKDRAHASFVCSSSRTKVIIL
jgi:hypothetical protein